MSGSSEQQHYRPVRLGDTISQDLYCTTGSTVVLSVAVETPEQVDYANDLVTAGRWRLSRCGQCGHVIDECGCCSTMIERLLKYAIEQRDAAIEVQRRSARGSDDEAFNSGRESAFHDILAAFDEERL